MLAAIDFTTVEIWSAKGLVTVYLLFVMAKIAAEDLEVAHWRIVPTAGCLARGKA